MPNAVPELPKKDPCLAKSWPMPEIDEKDLEHDRESVKSKKVRTPNGQ
jgi:hypothetical protein